MADDANPYAATVSQLFPAPAAQPQATPTSAPPATTPVQHTDMDGTALPDEAPSSPGAGPLIKEPVLPSEASGDQDQTAQPSPAPDANPYASTVAQLFPKAGASSPATPTEPTPDDTVPRFLAWRAANPQYDSVEALDVLRYAEASGRPVPFVAQNLAAVRKSVDASNVDLTNLAQKTPALANYLAGQGVRVDAAKPDMPHLSLLEQALTYPSDIGEAVLHTPEAFAQGASDLWQNTKDTASAWQFGAPAPAPQGPEQPSFEAKTWLGKAIMGNARMAPMVLVDRGLAWLGEKGGMALSAPADVAEEVGGGGPLDPGADAAVIATSTAASTALKLGLTGTFQYSQNTGPIFRQLLQVKGADGKPLDPDAARVIAQLGGLVVGGLTAVAGGPLGSELGASGQVSQDEVRQYAIREVMGSLLQGDRLQTATALMKRFGARAVSGALVMGAQGGLTQLLKEVGQGVAGSPVDLKGSAERVLGASWDSALNGLRDTSLLEGAHAAHDVYEEHARVMASVESAQRLGAVNDAAGASALLKAAPADGAELVKGIAQNPQSPPGVYVDKDHFDRLAQAAKVDPSQLAATVFGDNGKAYADAQAARSPELFVPMERHVAFASAHPDIAKELAPDSRLYQDAYTPRQAQDLTDRMGKAAAVPPEEMDDSQRQVYDDVKGKLVGAGVDEGGAHQAASVEAARYQNWAERIRANGGDASAWDIYPGRDLTIKDSRGRGLEPEPEDTSFDFGANDPRDQQVPVGDGVKLGPQAIVPTEGSMADARDMAQDLGPARRAQVETYLDYVRDHLGGKEEARVAPRIDRDLELRLADDYGIADPNGHYDEEALRRMRRGGQRRRGFAVNEAVAQAKADELRERTSKSVGARQHLEQPAAPEEAEPPAPRYDHLREHWSKTRDRTAKVGEYHRDEHTGLYNFAGYDALERDPKRPFTAAYELAGAKPLNDINGHSMVDHALTVQAQAARASGYVDGVRQGKKVAVDVETPEKAEQLRQAMEKRLGPGQKVTMGVAAGEGLDNGKRLKAALDAQKKAEQADAGLPTRKSPLPQYLEGLPKVDWEAKEGEAAQKDHLHPKGTPAEREQVKAMKATVKERMRPFVDALKREQAAFEEEGERSRAPIRQEHRDAFAKAVREGRDTFADIHIGEQGALNEQGHHLAEEWSIKEAKKLGKAEYGKKGANELVRATDHDGKPIERDGKPLMLPRWHAEFLHYVSADLRSVKDIDQKFGAGLDIDDEHRPTDEIVGQLVKWLARTHPDAEQLNLARPHSFGDELYSVFPGRAKDAAKARTFFEDADTASRRRLYHRPVAEGASTGEGSDVILQRGVRIAHGHGPDFEHADAAELERAKDAQDSGPEADRPAKPERVSAEKWRGVESAWTQREGHESRRVGEGLRERAAGDAGRAEGEGGAGRAAGPPGEGPGQEEKEEVDRHEQPSFTSEEGKAFRLESKKGRAYIDISDPDGEGRRRFEIHLGPKADMSSVLHEFEHMQIEVLSDLAQRPDAPQSLKDDYAGLLKFQGYDSHEQRVAETAERRELNQRGRAASEGAGPKLAAADQDRLRHLTAKEERLSHAWEQYFMEGKTPSVELAGAFARFKRWLTGIYKSVAGLQSHFRQTYGEEIGLTDEVRGIFDRQLASDDEVKRAQAAAGAQPFHELAEQMSPEDRAEYDKAAASAGEAAKDEVVRRLAAANREENDEFMRASRARIRGEVEKELDQNQTYRTLRYLQDGDTPESPGETPELLKGPDGKPLKLDRAALVKEYGADFVRLMPRDVFAAKGAPTEHVDDVASMLGWESGDAMVRALARSRPREDLVRQETQQRLEGRYGPSLIHDSQKMADAALDAVHSAAQVRKLLLERRALVKQLDPEGAGHHLDLDPDSLRRTAERMVADKTVGELMAGRDGAAGYYLRAERSAAARMRKAYEAGQLDRALAENEYQVFNRFLYREARDARDRLQTAERAMRQSAQGPWREALGKADVAAGGGESDHVYLGVHDAILQAVGMQPLPRGQTAPDFRAVDALLAKVGIGGLGFDPDDLRELLARPKPWRELTEPEAQNVLAAVRNIHRAAVTQNSIEIEGKRVDRQEWFQRARDLAAKGAQLPPEAYTSSGATAGEKLGHALRGSSAYLISVWNLVDQLDAGDRDGPWHQLFVDEYRTARAKLTELDTQISGQVKKHMDAMPKKLRARLYDRIPELPGLLPVNDRMQASLVRAPETRADLYGLYLNAGNVDNRQRLRDGNGWSDDQVNKALQLLKPAEAHFLQGLLDTTELMHPELAKVFERRTGMPMGKVEATPITIGGETFRGGYCPIKYARFARQGAVQMSDVESALYDSGYVPATVYSGHTKERMSWVKAPVSLEWGVLQTHLAQVTQDIAMGDWVRKTGSVVLDDRFPPIVNKRIGSERGAMFRPLLRDIANERNGSVAAAADSTPGFVRGLEGVVRSKYSQAVMSANLPSLLAHLTDPLAAIGDTYGVGEMATRTWWTGEAYLKTVAATVAAGRSPADRPEYALSKELAYRDARMTANISRELGTWRLSSTPGVRQAEKVAGVVNHVSELARHRLDMFHAKALWQTGYDEGISQGMTMQDAARHGDDILSKTLPSGEVAEKSPIQRSKRGIASVVTFYGYANKMFNLWVHAPLARARDAWTGPGATWGTRATSAGDLAAKWVTMGAIAALGAKLAGRGPNPDEDKKALMGGEGTSGWLVRRMLLEPGNTIPVLGPALEQIADGRQVSVRTAPGVEVLEGMAGKLERAIKKAQDGGGNDAEVWQALEFMIGTALGPTGQLQRTGGYVRDVATGQAQPQGPLDVGKGLIYGSPPARR